MKCPDCGSVITLVPMGDKSQTYRCFKCGGFWLDGWTVNRMSSKMLAMWRRINVNSGFLIHGSGVCPQDQTVLETYRGESIPPTITVKRCIRCGKWWFPGDTLFDYKPALEAKVNYFRLWGISSNVFNLALPVMGIVLLIGGLATGVVITRQRMQTNSQATSGETVPSIMYLGGGEVEIAFVSRDPVTTVAYKKYSDKVWIQASVEMNKGLYEVKLSGIETDENYTLKILDKEYLMRVSE